MDKSQKLIDMIICDIVYHCYDYDYARASNTPNVQRLPEELLILKGPLTQLAVFAGEARVTDTGESSIVVLAETLAVLPTHVRPHQTAARLHHQAAVYH